MRTVTDRGLTLSLIIGLAAAVAPVIQGFAASDPRFFGTYCGEHRESVTFQVPCFPLFPWWLCPVTHHVNMNLEVHADYRETHLGNGLVNGSGSAEVKGHDLPAGRAEEYGVQVGARMPLVFSGRVVSIGRLEGSALAPGREPASGSASLSAGGLALELVGLDRTLNLRKDRCGNTAPSAEITPPAEPSVPYGQLTPLHARYHDGEDASIPTERLVWTSSLEDRRLGNGDSIYLNDLSPGHHTITFTVTDSGGLSGSDTEVITIENDAPNTTIDDPTAGSEHCEGMDIPFRGHAHDAQSGDLRGEDLKWETSEGVFLGTGKSFSRPLGAGTHTIRLTADDGVSTGHDEVTIQVNRCAGNAPPTVRITMPEHLSAPVTGIPSNYTPPEVAPDPNPYCLRLIAEARDFEGNPITGDDLVWTDQPFGLFAPRGLGRGESIEACNLVAPDGDHLHTITVRANDSAGSTAEDSIQIIVIGAGAGVGGVY